MKVTDSVRPSPEMRGQYLIEKKGIHSSHGLPMVSSWLALQEKL